MDKTVVGCGITPGFVEINATQLMRETIYILAGGQSTRMEYDKALLPWGKDTLLAERVSCFKAAKYEVKVLSSKAKHVDTRWHCIPDVYPHCGPVGAIDAALQEAQTDFLLFFPVDMPFIHPEGLRQLCDAAPDALISLFSIEEKPMMFPLRLHRCVAPEWRNLLKQNTRKLHDVVRAFHPIFVPGDALQKVNPYFFFNVNTPEQYQQALAWKNRPFV